VEDALGDAQCCFITDVKKAKVSCEGSVWPGGARCAPWGAGAGRL
jgi:hypothetical protein